MINTKDIDEAIESSQRNHKIKRGKMGEINDSEFRISTEIDGVRYMHSGYMAWKRMHQRCYSPLSIARHPTYSKCEVCDEWIIFSEFFIWWKENNVYGWDLDKDLLFPGNKVYGPSTCIYVPRELNVFLTGMTSKKSKYLPGVIFLGGNYPFLSRVRDGKKQIVIGRFKTEIEAHEAWFSKKMEIAKDHKDLCDSIRPGLYGSIIAQLSKFKEIT